VVSFSPGHLPPWIDPSVSIAQQIRCIPDHIRTMWVRKFVGKQTPTLQSINILTDQPSFLITNMHFSSTFPYIRVSYFYKSSALFPYSFLCLFQILVTQGISRRSCLESFSVLILGTKFPMWFLNSAPTIFHLFLEQQKVSLEF
jgi:hypothetical protein